MREFAAKAAEMNSFVTDTDLRDKLQTVLDQVDRMFDVVDKVQMYAESAQTLVSEASSSEERAAIIDSLLEPIQRHLADGNLGFISDFAARGGGAVMDVLKEMAAKLAQPLIDQLKSVAEGMIGTAGDGSPMGQVQEYLENLLEPLRDMADQVDSYLAMARGVLTLLERFLDGEGPLAHILALPTRLGTLCDSVLPSLQASTLSNATEIESSLRRQAGQLTTVDRWPTYYVPWHYSSSCRPLRWAGLLTTV